MRDIEEIPTAEEQIGQESEEMARFNANANLVRTARSTYKRLRENKEFEEARDFLRENREFVVPSIFSQNIKVAEKRINKLKERRNKIATSERSSETRAVIIKNIDRQIEMIAARANSRKNP